MIYAFVPHDNIMDRVDVSGPVQLPANAIWYDLFEPTPEDRARAEAALSIRIPTREEMREIEPSSRLYTEGEAIYMTATFFARADDPNPMSEPLTFILTRHSLVTLRYTDPRPIATYSARLMRLPCTRATCDEALTGLLETFVDRIADILEKLGADLDALSRQIFDATPASKKPRDMQAILRSLGRFDDLASTARESLMSLNRLLRFLLQTFESNTRKETKEQRTRVKTLMRDLGSLTEHAAFEAHKVNFLLDATLGFINIEQNTIIKIFSVAAVVFLPPTLIASIYGMNFKHIPELELVYGYPMAIGLMVLSAVLPYIYFKRKGWL
ncbi:MAG: magnesium/cobalt transporter CorA [Proteobacteria bacterium]|nr:magnesium/cobalt transporter CorA [Pseudomonadota bacterium]